MKVIQFTLAGAALAACMSSAIASNVTVLSLGGRPFVDSTNTPLAVGSLVRVGYFTDFADNEATIRNGSIGQIEALFNEIGDATADGGSGTGTAAVNNPFTQEGGVSNTINGVNDGAVFAPPTYEDAGFNTLKTVFAIWVWKDDNSEHGIFTTTDDAWAVPAQALADITLNTGVGSLDALRGVVNSTNLQLERIPEPNVFGLLMVGLAGWFGFGRRRR